MILDIAEEAIEFIRSFCSGNEHTENAVFAHYRGIEIS